jgi:hypothetical protein
MISTLGENISFSLIDLTTAIRPSFKETIEPIGQTPIILKKLSNKTGSNRLPFHFLIISYILLGG